MNEFMHLIGANDVRAAGNAISSAAGQIQSAAGQFDSSVQDLKRFMDDWLQRFEYLLNEQQKNQNNKEDESDE